MKGAVTIFEAVLIVAISVSLAALAVPWAYASLQRSLDISEMATIKDQLELCNDKLVETARTGTSNVCIFSANRGRMTAQTDGLYYGLTSNANICDAHSWGEVDKDRHLESSCDIVSELSSYGMRWRWPSSVTMEATSLSGNLYKEGEIKNSITFDGNLQFITVTVVVDFNYVPGQSGKRVEISRLDIEEEKATLSVNIK